VRLWHALVLAAAFLLPGCGSPQNLLQDPGFEQGGQGWFWLEAQSTWQPYEITEGHALSGQRAATAHLVSQGQGDTEIAGLVQNFTLDATDGRLPRSISGHYQVERWQSNVDKTYLQAVVTLYPKAGAEQPLCPGLPEPSNPCQVAFPLAGLDRIPFAIANRRFVFVGTTEPVVGPWQAFDIALKDEFTRAWGVEPTEVDHAWIYFEVRYEKEGDTVPAVDVLVHWDDLALRP
jgi:hypothetical protein